MLKMLKQAENIRLTDEFIKATEGQKIQVGCYDITIRNNTTGEERTTQGDAPAGYTWSDLKYWLLEDIYEMDFGEYEDLSIVSVEYAGIDDIYAFAV